MCIRDESEAGIVGGEEALFPISDIPMRHDREFDILEEPRGGIVRQLVSMVAAPGVTWGQRGIGCVRRVIGVVKHSTKAKE
jgi:hypothetical protein